MKPRKAACHEFSGGWPVGPESFVIVMRPVSIRLTIGLLVLLHGAAHAVEKQTENEGPIRHVVIAWLKHPGDTAARNRFIEVTKSFASLPGVVSTSVGPVLASGRSVVDSSFDVATVLTFKDKKALGEYLNHPKHLRAVKQVLDPLVEKVIVYDFVAH